jgi:hypothetical protein
MNHTWKISMWKMWWMCQSENKYLLVKITFVSGWKSSIKKGRLTFINGCRRWRVAMISLSGTTIMFRTNARNVLTYYSTCANAYVWHHHANGGGEGSKAISKNLWEVRTWVLIMFSSCNVSQLLIVYWYK